MVELAIHNEKKLSIDLREIENENISYTVNTLKSLRADFLDDALFLIVGEDVFNLIDNWRDWESLLFECSQNCHINYIVSIFLNVNFTKFSIKPKA